VSCNVVLRGIINEGLEGECQQLDFQRALSGPVWVIWEMHGPCAADQPGARGTAVARGVCSGLVAAERDRDATLDLLTEVKDVVCQLAMVGLSRHLLDAAPDKSQRPSKLHAMCHVHSAST
jgi:hypothetical protein